MVEWLAAIIGSLTVSDWIQLGVGIVLTLTLVAIVYYAAQTKKQAEATLKMVEETTEQRLSSMMPALVIKIDMPIGNAYLSTQMIQCLLKNVGPGPALEILLSENFAPEKEGVSKVEFLRPGECISIFFVSDTYMKSGVRPNDKVFLQYKDCFGRSWETAYGLELDEERRLSFNFQSIAPREGFNAR